MQGAYGVFTREQAVESGLSPRQLRYRVSQGQLLELLPGIYIRSENTVTWEQWLSAAIAWSGPMSAATGLSAAAIWELDGFPRERVEVVTVRRLRCPVPHILVREAKLNQSDIRVRESLRVTSPERTLFDLARHASPRSLENAVDHALGKRLTTVERVKDYAQANGARGVAGTTNMKKVIEELHQVPGTDLFERKLFRCLTSAGLPPPCAQFLVQIGSERYYLDYAYPELKIGIEAHSFRHHSGRPKWERDQARNNALVGAGWKLLYITWRQLRDHPTRVVTSIASARSNAQDLLF